MSLRVSPQRLRCSFHRMTRDLNIGNACHPEHRVAVRRIPRIKAFIRTDRGFFARPGNRDSLRMTGVVISREHATRSVGIMIPSATEAIPLRLRRGVEVGANDPGDCFGLPPFKPSVHKKTIYRSRAVGLAVTGSCSTSSKIH